MGAWSGSESAWCCLTQWAVLHHCLAAAAAAVLEQGCGSWGCQGQGCRQTCCKGCYQGRITCSRPLHLCRRCHHLRWWQPEAADWPATGVACWASGGWLCGRQLSQP